MAGKDGRAERVPFDSRAKQGGDQINLDNRFAPDLPPTVTVDVEQRTSEKQATEDVIEGHIYVEKGVYVEMVRAPMNSGSWSLFMSKIFLYSSISC